MPSGAATGGTASWVAETWAARLADSLETMTGERPRVGCRAAAGEAEAAAAGTLWWEQPFSLGPRAAVCTGAPEAAWLAIGRHTLASAGIEATEPADARNTFLEVSSQAFSGLAQAISARVGKSVSCENGAEAADVRPGGVLFEIELALPGSPPVILRLSVSQPLSDMLSPDASGALELLGPSQPAGALEQPASRGTNGNTLDLLMEVELPVSVSFGRADLALKDVLKLTTGSIVELNRVLTEPVEVIVNNCVIARGEVVVIEGNYGVRIHEIISRDRRLRTLR